MDYNSAQNQNICRRFVEQNVYACFSYEMDILLSAGANGVDNCPDISDIENLYTFYINGKRMDSDEKDEHIENLRDRGAQIEETVCNLTGESDPSVINPECFDDPEELADLISEWESHGESIEKAEETEEEPAEIYEWWAVSRYLADQLRGYNECILEFGNNTYWGRQTTGQAIYIDGVITSIAEDMEILEGQANSWAQ